MDTFGKQMFSLYQIRIVYTQNKFLSCANLSKRPLDFVKLLVFSTIYPNLQISLHGHMSHPRQCATLTKGGEEAHLPLRRAVLLGKTAKDGVEWAAKEVWGGMGKEEFGWTAKEEVPLLAKEEVLLTAKEEVLAARGM